MNCHPYISKVAIATATENEKDLYGKNISCHSVTVEWFSIQVLVNFEIFKPSFNLSLSLIRAQIFCYKKNKI